MTIDLSLFNWAFGAVKSGWLAMKITQDNQEQEIKEIRVPPENKLKLLLLFGKSVRE